MGRLATLFDPETVGVVGATDREGAVGRAILENLQSAYEGEIVPRFDLFEQSVVVFVDVLGVDLERLGERRAVFGDDIGTGDDLALVVASVAFRVSVAHREPLECWISWVGAAAVSASSR